MRAQITVCLLTVTLLTGCKAIDGTYYPGCTAFEGDKLVLSAGDFVWDRFTDQVSVDADGNVVDPFPDYPRMGSYEISAQVLRLTLQDDSVQTFHIHKHENVTMLLNAADQAAWETSGQYGGCVLTLRPEEVS